MTHRLLIVDDETNYRRVLCLMLQDLDVELLEAQDGQEALEKLEREDVDLVIADVNMPRLSGLGLLAALQARPGAPPVVIITAGTSVESAVEAMRLGAIDYLTKPFDEERLKLTLERALRVTSLLAENQRLRDEVLKNADFSSMVGESPALVAALKLAAKLAASDSNVLVRGESGTGKELLARALHENSKRRRGPFVALNCAALPENLLEAELFGHEAGAFTGAAKRRRGRVEVARGGTLFLDEIGDMPLALQSKMLRLLQERTFQPLGGEHELKADVRFVFATHRDLRVAVREGHFREDLMFRVDVLSVELPPLRARGDDVLLLAEAMAQRLCASMGRKPMRFTAQAQAALCAHAWPGNVRELGNVVERAVLLSEGSAIDAYDLELPTTTAAAPTSTPSPATASTSTVAATTSTVSAGHLLVLPDQGLSLDALERDLVQQALQRARGNKSQAARLLGLTRATLRYRLDKLNDDKAHENNSNESLDLAEEGSGA